MMGPSLLLILMLVLLVFWVIQFTELMGMSDGEFPGKHDKILWFVAFLSLNFVGAAVFVAWKQVRIMARARAREGEIERAPERETEHPASSKPF
jgi:hypothetical protein